MEITQNTNNKPIVIGIDIGTVKIAWVVLDMDNGDIVESGFKRHNGSPEEIKNIILAVKNKLGCDSVVKEIIAVGAMAELLNDSVRIIPERAAQEEACKILYPDCQPSHLDRGALDIAASGNLATEIERSRCGSKSFNLLKLGGNGFSILTFENKKFTKLNKAANYSEQEKSSNILKNNTSKNDAYLTGFSYAANDKCSSGTGSAIESLCKGRFGIDVNEACELAQNAQKPQKIAARCSVFVKSEITHLANQGYSKEDILASYFNSLAVNIWALVKKKKVVGKFILIGGVAKNKEIIKNLEKLIDEKIEISPLSDIFEAFGASEIALKLARAQKTQCQGTLRYPDMVDHLTQSLRCTGKSGVLPNSDRSEFLTRANISVPIAVDFEKIGLHKKKEITKLPPLFLHQEKVKKYAPKDLDIADLENKEIIIGLDLGSTGSKLAIIDVNNKQLLYNDYLPTKGNPVGASQELIKKIPANFLTKVCAIGITGSGRNTVATVLKATCLPPAQAGRRQAFPEFADYIIVKTEIISHAKSAANFDKDNGKSLSVIEIGGQDAKYTYVSEGEVEDSIMNMACAAGTGSFLEEQGIFYGVDNISEFAKMAYASKNPANLGQHCTVFVAELANKALREGYSLEDIFAGFYYSVIYNYVNRVMGKRMFGDKIFLQGMPATHLALACALAGVTGKEVIVPPNPGAMGAIGIALLALENYARDEKFCASAKSEKDDIKYFDLNKFLSAKIISRGEFQCQNPKCGNLCRINTTTVEVAGEEKKVLSGGMCPKYEQSKANKLPAEAPNPFKEREKLLNEITEPERKNPPDPLYERGNNKRTVGIPAGLGVVRFIPLMAVFFDCLGFNVKILKTNAETMEKGDALCSSYDTCAPIKIMHGLFEKTDYYFCPKIKALPIIKDEDGSCTCPLVQGAPNLVEFSVQQKFLKPILDFSQGISHEKVKSEFRKMAGHLGVGKDEAESAFKQAAEKQKQYEDGLLAIGRRAIDYARDNNLPVILICGRLYTLYDSLLNSSIPQAIQENGAIALPIDCYPARAETDILHIMYWGEGQRNLRGILDSFKRDNVFPIWISNYICGPDSFLEHFFKNICKGYPHMNLETDGHSGVAGFITRIEAFLHTCRIYTNKNLNKRPSPNVSCYDLAYMGAKEKDILEYGIKLIIPPMGDGNEFLAAAFRSIGVDAVALPPVDREHFMLARKDCSGKECLPFLCLWGSIKQYLLSNLKLRAETAQRPAKLIFLVPTTEGPCRYCMYHIRIKQLVDELLKNLGYEIDIKFYSPSTENSYFAQFDNSFKLKMWAGVVSSDLLRDMLHYIRPIAKEPEQAEKLYDYYKNQFVKILEKKSSKRDVFRFWGFTSLMKQAAMSFRKLEIDNEKREKIMDVVMSGEIYVREEIFANDDLIRKLEKYGMRTRLAPFREWINYLHFCENAKLRETEHKSKQLKFFQNAFAKLAFSLGGGIARKIKKKMEILAMSFFEQKLYNICAEILYWRRDHLIKDVVDAGHPYLGDAPQGEAILSIGSPILMYKNKEIKGAVLIGPYGCMPTKLAEAQLNRTEVPFLAVFVDGEPIDESRIANFAWQLGGIDSLR